jgi:hypothetical protein
MTETVSNNKQTPDVFTSIKSDIESSGMAGKAIVDFTSVGDVLTLGAAAVAATGRPLTYAVAKDLAIKAGRVALNFIPIEKVAFRAIELIGSSISKNIVDTLVTDVFLKELSDVAIVNIDEALKKGIIKFEDLFQSGVAGVKDHISIMVKGKIDEAFDLIEPLIISGNKQGLKVEEINELLINSKLFGVEESKELSELLSKNCFSSINTREKLDDIHKVLEKKLNVQVKELMTKVLEEGNFGKAFTDSFSPNIEDLINSSNKLSDDKKIALIAKFKDESTQLKMLSDGVEQGLDEGIKLGLKARFDKLKAKLSVLPHFKRKFNPKNPDVTDSEQLESPDTKFKFSKLIDWSRFKNANASKTSNPKTSIASDKSPATTANSEEVKLKSDLLVGHTEISVTKLGEPSKVADKSLEVVGKKE